MGRLEIVIEAAGGGVILRLTGGNGGHHRGGAGHKAEDLVGDVDILHSGTESGADHSAAVRRLYTRGGGLKQMADGTDIGIYILGKIYAVHNTSPFIIIVIKKHNTL